MSILSVEDFMKKYNLKNDTMNESDLQKIYIYPIYPRDSKICSDKGFVKIGYGSQGVNRWTVSYIKVKKKTFHFDSFGSAPDKFLPNQLPKPILYHNYKIQNNHSKLCGTYCFYFFYLMERMNNHDAILKMYSGLINADKCIWKLFLT